MNNVLLNNYRHVFTSCVTDSMVAGHSVSQYDSVNSFLEDHDVLSSKIQLLYKNNKKATT